MKFLVGRTREELRQVVENLGFEGYRGDQVLKWIYKKCIQDPMEMTDLPTTLREKLAENFSISPLKVLKTQKSYDGTLKFLFQLPDGERVESVYIPDGKRRTLCISSQVGCALGCRFCVTGTLGFKRNLSAQEIVAQVWEVKKYHPLTNIVFMGMGEPLLNMDALVKSVDILVGSRYFDFSRRKVTVSTAGIVPGIVEIAEMDLPVRLAVSLNSTVDDVRSEIMPINKKYGLSELLEALEFYQKETGNWVTLEFVLMDGVNCNRKEIEGLRRITRKIKAKVNIIPFNKDPNLPFSPPPDEKINWFQRSLVERGITAIIRKSRGPDIKAACGQLSAEYGGSSG